MSSSELLMSDFEYSLARASPSAQHSPAARPGGRAPLLATKLHRPHTSAPLVPRPRLLEQLTAGLNRRLTLISAPAGYGKTTVVNQWLDTLDLPWAWLSLDEQDGDLAVFLSYLLAALRTVYLDAGHALSLALRLPTLPAPARLADVLLADLDALSGPLLLALDDYHLIQSLEVHGAMARLVQYLPTHVHLVLTVRSDPPLSLERLRGRQQLNELRGADLRFTPGEAGRLVHQIMGAATSDETIMLLEESTEGWAVGLQLAALTLRGQSDPAAFARRIAQNSNQLVIDYLLAEVLHGLPDEQRDLLLRTSLLERFCAPLCDAMRSENDQALGSAAFLTAARRSNLFLTPLDQEGTWFRYHHLFRHLLRNRLLQAYGEAEIRAMHARASAWFASQNLLREAIVHAVQAGDSLRAATLVEDHAHGALDREDWRQIEHWIGLLPVDLLSRPRLLAVQGWLNFIRYRLETLGALVEAVEEAIARAEAAGEALPPTLWGEVATLRAAIAYNDNDAAETVRWAGLAMQQLRPEMQYVMGLASLFYLNGLQVTGQHREAVAFAHRQLGLYGQYPALALRILLGLANVHYEMADVAAMQNPATALDQLAQQVGLGLSVAWADYAQGWLHYQRNELAAAEQRFRALAGTAHGRTLVDGSTGLALVLLAQGRPDEASAVAVALRDCLLERGLLALVPLAESLRQRVLLHRDPAAAQAQGYRAPETPFPLEYWEQPTLTQVRTLLVSSAPEDLALALELLANRRAQATARHARRVLVEIEGLQALVLAAQGHEDAALVALRQAVELAAPGGALRQLADCGPGLAGLLKKLADDRVAPAYVRQVLAALGAAHDLAQPTSAGPTTTSSVLVETLTNREIDVLLLLAERLTDKEIAERLVLSPVTVKKHTSHIYRKLGVHNRRAAAEMARRLGLV